MVARKSHLYRAIDIIKAVLVRSAFIVHMLFCVWAATCVTNKNQLWALTVLIAFFMVEAIYNIVKRHGQEPKWFSPCVFLFIVTVVPPIWLLNLDYMHCKQSMEIPNATKTTCNGLQGTAYVCSIVRLENIFNRKPMVFTLVDIMLLLLIVGRWILPKGPVSREQLSVLLFVYFGVAFDILDLITLFEEDGVLYLPGLQIAILSLMTISLFQFAIVVTSTKRRKPKLKEESDPPVNSVLTRCCESEIWGLMTSVVMQDGPFLILRLYCLIGLHIFSYTLLLYTIKNILIILLQFYRLIVLILKCKDDFDEYDAGSLGSLKARSTQSLDSIVNHKQLDYHRQRQRQQYRSQNSIASVKDMSFESTV